MSRRGLNCAMTILAALALAMPMAARDAAAKDSKATTTTVDIRNPTSLSGKPLKPGSYRVIADDSKVTLKLNGKVAAEAPVQWKEAPSKAKYSAIVTGDRGVREIHFDGKTRYVEIAD
jgi:hypothetical protein